MPFGKHKGTPLGDISDVDLESTIAWCSSDNEKAEKFKDLIAACREVLTDRLVASVVDGDDTDSLPF